MVIFFIMVIMEGRLRCVEIDQSKRLTLWYCEGYSFWALKNSFRACGNFYPVLRKLAHHPPTLVFFQGGEYHKHLTAFP